MTNAPRSPGTKSSKAHSVLETSLVSGFVIVLTLVVGILLARTLTPAERGSYGAIQFWAQIGFAVFNLSLYDAMTIRLRARGDTTQEAFPLALLLAGVMFLVTALIAFSAFRLEMVVVAGVPEALVLTLVVMSFWFLEYAFISVETASLSFRPLNLDRIISPVFFLIAVISLSVVGEATVVTLLIAFVLTKLPVLFARIWRFRHHLVGPIDRSLAREVVRLGPRLHMATGTLALASQIDRIAVVSLWPADWVGYYFVAYSAAGAGMSLASQAIQITLLPHFAGLDIAVKRAMVERVFRLALVAGAGIAVPVFALAPWIVPLVYGTDFAPASDYVRGVVVAMAFVPALWVVNVANRAGERGRPGMEMALAALAVFGAAWLLTGFAQPIHLFTTMTVANLVSIAAGLRHLRLEGSVGSYTALIPSHHDAAYAVRLVKDILRRRSKEP